MNHPPTAVFFATVILAALLPAQRQNVAYFSGTATQSSTNGSMVASLAKDRNHSGNNSLCCSGSPWANTPSIACTANLPLSWWQLSLTSPRLIDEVLIWNRADADFERLGNFRVELFNGSTLVFTQDFYTNGGHVPSGGHVRVLPPVTPLAVSLCRITKLGASPANDHRLQLAEVELWATVPFALDPPYYLTNIAPYGTATTSHLGIGSPGPQVAIDGNSDGWAPNGSTFWSLSFPGAWLRVDLPAPATLRQISLYNRNDALIERMSRYRVRAFNGTTEVFARYELGVTLPSIGRHYTIDNTTTQCTHVIVDSYGQGLTAEEIVQLSEIEIWVQNYNFNIQGEALPFGVGCEHAGGAPRTALVTGQRPRIGTSFTTQVGNAMPIGGGQYAAFLMTGFQASNGLGQPLPLFSGSTGVPGCWLLTSPDILTFGFAAGNTVSYPLSIPNNFAFLNLRLWQQALLLDGASTYANGVVFGNGVRLTVGL